MVEFHPMDSFVVSNRDWTVLTGPCPLASTEERGRDFIGQTWMVKGKPRKVKALETFAVPGPLRAGVQIGVVFEDE